MFPHLLGQHKLHRKVSENRQVLNIKEKESNIVRSVKTLKEKLLDYVKDGFALKFKQFKKQSKELCGMSRLSWQASERIHQKRRRDQEK